MIVKEWWTTSIFVVSFSVMKRSKIWKAPTDRLDPDKRRLDPAECLAPTNPVRSGQAPGAYRS